MLLRKIEDLGLFNNTAVVFTTDHGFYLGEHNLTGKSIITPEFQGNAPLYEEITHIPLLIRLPNAKKGFRSSAIVQPPDLTATIVDLANAENPGIFQGKSLLPILEGKKTVCRDFAVTSPSLVHGTAGAARPTITDGEYSLIYIGSFLTDLKTDYTTKAVDGISRTLKPLTKIENELYHLPSDPQQKRNIFPEQRDIAKKLHSKFLSLLGKSSMSKENLRYWLKV